jgi:hypothetical protein
MKFNNKWTVGLVLVGIVTWCSVARAQGTLSYSSIDESTFNGYNTAWVADINTAGNMGFSSDPSSVRSYDAGGALNSSITINESGGVVTFSVFVENGVGGSTGESVTTSINSLDTLTGLAIAIFSPNQSSGEVATVNNWYIGSSLRQTVADTTSSTFSGMLASFDSPQSSFTSSYTLQTGIASGSDIYVIGIAAGPVLVNQPTNQIVQAGSNVVFNVVANGQQPLAYQWLFNSNPIAIATNVSLSLTNVQLSNAGYYSVVITNSGGSVTSSNAFLTVVAPPTMALQFSAGYPSLNLNGMLSNNFVVQYSTNLTGTNWINLLSVTNLSSSPYQFLDPAGIVPPARFYRAFMQ